MNRLAIIANIRYNIILLGFVTSAPRKAFALKFTIFGILASNGH